MVPSLRGTLDLTRTLDPGGFHPRQLSIYMAYFYNGDCLLSSLHNIQSLEHKIQSVCSAFENKRMGATWKSFVTSLVNRISNVAYTYSSLQLRISKENMKRKQNVVTENERKWSSAKLPLSQLREHIMSVCTHMRFPLQSSHHLHFVSSRLKTQRQPIFSR